MTEPRRGDDFGLGRAIRVMIGGALMLIGFHVVLSLPDGGPGAFELALLALLLLAPIALVAPASLLPGRVFGGALAVAALGALAPLGMSGGGAGPVDATTLFERPALLGYLAVLVVFLGLALEGLRRLILWERARQTRD